MSSFPHPWLFHVTHVNYYYLKTCNQNYDKIESFGCWPHVTRNINFTLHSPHIN